MSLFCVLGLQGEVTQIWGKTRRSEAVEPKACEGDLPDMRPLCTSVYLRVCLGAEAKEVDERGKARPRVGGELHVNILRATGLILGNICLSW